MHIVPAEEPGDGEVGLCLACVCVLRERVRGWGGEKERRRRSRRRASENLNDLGEEERGGCGTYAIRSDVCAYNKRG